MRTIEVKLYQFEELSDAAKEKAREWWKELESQDFGGHGDLFEFAETAAGLLGIEFGTKAVPLHGGGTRQEPDIYWSGFSSQGDGASFVGSYSYKKGCAKAVRAEFGTDNELWRIADGLTALQKQHGYKLECKITQDGRYSHSHTMNVDITAPESVANVEDCHYEGSRLVIHEPLNTLLDLIRNFADWIYKGLEEEYDYRMSDERVDDTLIANEYEFTEKGERA